MLGQNRRKKLIYVGFSLTSVGLWPMEVSAITVVGAMARMVGWCTMRIERKSHCPTLVLFSPFFPDFNSKNIASFTIHFLFLLYLCISKLVHIFVNFLKTILKNCVQNGTACTIYVMTLKSNLHVYI
jgi:hypothetical protein